MNREQLEIHKYTKQKAFEHLLKGFHEVYFARFKGFFCFALVMIIYPILEINKFYAISKLLSVGFFVILFLSIALFILTVFWSNKIQTELEFKSNEHVKGLLDMNNKGEIEGGAEGLKTEVKMDEHNRIIRCTATILVLTILGLSFFCTGIMIFCL